jgi:hypothetical protein
LFSEEQIDGVIVTFLVVTGASQEAKRVPSTLLKTSVVILSSPTFAFIVVSETLSGMHIVDRRITFRFSDR